MKVRARLLILLQVFLPTVLLTIFMPALTTVLTNLAEKLTVLENYETQDCKSPMCLLR